MEVFISYKSEYRPFARKLRDHLQNWGHRTWLDEDNIPRGAYFRHEIQKGLESAEVVIGVVTPEAIDSREVMAEWDYALTNPRRRLLLVKYQDAQLPYHLAGLQYIDFTRDELRAFNQLEQALLIPYEKPSPSQNAVPIAHAPLKKVAVTNRERMLEKVNYFWVKGVLENTLHESGAFDLGLEINPEAVLKHKHYGDYTLPNSANIADIFQDMNRELLILGAPGSGKTVLLLQLARELIQRAQADEQQPIPTVFNLSSWAVDRKPLSEWLKDELRIRYQVPKKVALNWIEGEQLLLLLDGLDEVMESSRDDCVEAINAFRREYRSVDMVVCSRTADYNTLAHKLDLQSAIMLQPLSEQQISSYIQGEEFTDLLKVMRQDATLQAMAKTPFLLNTIAFSYRKASVVNLALPASDDNEAGRRNHLFESYIKQRLKDALSHGAYTPKQIRHYLSYLASKMVERQQTIFYIESIQPYWLETPSQLRLHRIAIKAAMGLTYGLAFGIIYGVLAGLTHGLVTHWLDGLLYGLAVTLVILVPLGLLTGLPVQMSEIEVGDTLNFHWSKDDMVWGFINAIFIAAIIGFIAWFVGMLPMGGMVALAAGAVGFMEAGLKSAERLDMRSRPNQGLRITFWNALRAGVMVALSVGLISLVSIGLMVNLAAGIAVAVVSGLGFGIFLALSNGIRSAVRHLVLRVILHRDDEIPRNYAHFLDYAAKDLLLLRKVGGGYIFVHRMLLEYFASQK
ncbi:MAG: TIR domain-containing protein [Chloroflexi bacterium]|nr:TIR domain-containing protein [Chloroflexota bacterium]